MRKTITVTVQQDQWIKAQIAAGDFTNDSEYIRDLIRRDQARRARVDAIRSELIKGEASGEPEPFDGESFKEEMVAKHVGSPRRTHDGSDTQSAIATFCSIPGV